MKDYQEPREEVAGLEVGPLSAYRIDFLQAAGNVTAGGEGGNTGSRSIAEVFLACACTVEELAAVRVEAQERWEAAVDDFFRGLSDDQIEQFGSWLKARYGEMTEEGGE